MEAVTLRAGSDDEVRKRSATDERISVLARRPPADVHAHEIRAVEVHVDLLHRGLHQRFHARQAAVVIRRRRDEVARADENVIVRHVRLLEKGHAVDAAREAAVRRADALRVWIIRAPDLDRDADAVEDALHVHPEVAPREHVARRRTGREHEVIGFEHAAVLKHRLANAIAGAHETLDVHVRELDLSVAAQDRVELLNEYSGVEPTLVADVECARRTIALLGHVVRDIARRDELEGLGELLERRHYRIEVLIVEVVGRGVVHDVGSGLDTAIAREALALFAGLHDLLLEARPHTRREIAQLEAVEIELGVERADFDFRKGVEHRRGGNRRRTLALGGPDDDDAIAERGAFR